MSKRVYIRIQIGFKVHDTNCVCRQYFPFKFYVNEMKIELRCCTLHKCFPRHHLRFRSNFMHKLVHLSISLAVFSVLSFVFKLFQKLFLFRQPLSMQINHAHSPKSQFTFTHKCLRMLSELRILCSKKKDGKNCQQTIKRYMKRKQTDLFCSFNQRSMMFDFAIYQFIKTAHNPLKWNGFFLLFRHK